ncbi:MarR family transcriptional regulator [Streptomyces sp. WM4235]|uniref:MarR family winged helix-turn-helix transcriptional regulator n=1 Tax=Streptomyces sp. WM4235 TaxID=1415551 RepID=UPI0006AE2C00|nr:MarR family transcriptional regulator [Streptomyces sp. WM4235]KOU57283.1 MarR family transcriptional regulator [Streptomyces sp. WM4235]
MDVNVDSAAGPDVHANTLREQLRNMTLRQQRFERYLGRELHTDSAGLTVMGHLVSVGPTSPTDLARALGTSTAAMTLVIDRLVAAGHATRRPHPTDRRKVIVTPADDWEARSYAYVSPLIQGVTAAATNLTPEEQVTVAAFLERIIAAYDHATHP